MEQERLQKLKKIIEILKERPQIEWTDSGVSGGVLTIPYPIYPKWVHEAFSFLRQDHKYLENMEVISNKHIRICEYGIDELTTHLTFIQRRERFCDGFIATQIDNGMLLMLLERLYEIEK